MYSNASSSSRSIYKKANKKFKIYYNEKKKLIIILNNQSKAKAYKTVLLATL